MNREIKFRAWDTKEKNFIHFKAIGGLLAECDGTYVHNFVHLGNIMQFTSLRDTSGRDIYQDDVVEGKDGIRGQVLLRLGCWYISWGCELGYYQGKLYVIGNVYENPELLEGEDG